MTAVRFGALLWGRKSANVSIQCLWSMDRVLIIFVSMRIYIVGLNCVHRLLLTWLECKFVNTWIVYYKNCITPIWTSRHWWWLICATSPSRNLVAGTTGARTRECEICMAIMRECENTRKQERDKFCARVKARVREIFISHSRRPILAFSLCNYRLFVFSHSRPGPGAFIDMRRTHFRLPTHAALPRWGSATYHLPKVKMTPQPEVQI